MKGDTLAAAGFCAGLPRPVRVAYEAGPTGYGLARELAKRGVECVVAAPSKIPRATGDRVKTDRRDAEHLVRLLLAGKLHRGPGPGPEEEALRDLVRARETLRLDLMRARHRLSKLLLRHGVRFDDGRAWTERHRAWLKTVDLEWPAAQATLLDAAGRDRRALSPPRAVGARDHRRSFPARRGQAGRPVALPARRRHADRGRAVRRGRRLRTVRPRRAADELPRAGPVGVNDREQPAARIDHEDRIGARPPAARRSRAGTTAKRRRCARPSTDRQAGQPPEAVAIAWTAQRRLHRTWARLEARNKRRTIIAVAVARELVGFCWAVTQIE